MSILLQSRVLSFPTGLIGLPCDKTFRLEEADSFQWLQGHTRRFAVVDPRTFFPDFTVPGHSDADLLVIVNRHGEWITGNLKAPLVIDRETGEAEQVILHDGKWRTDQPLVRAIAKAA